MLLGACRRLVGAAYLLTTQHVARVLAVHLDYKKFQFSHLKKVLTSDKIVKLITEINLVFFERKKLQSSLEYQQPKQSCWIHPTQSSASYRYKINYQKYLWASKQQSQSFRAQKQVLKLNIELQYTRGNRQWVRLKLSHYHLQIFCFNVAKYKLGA